MTASAADEEVVGQWLKPRGTLIGRGEFEGGNEPRERRTCKGNRGKRKGRNQAERRMPSGFWLAYLRGCMLFHFSVIRTPAGY